MDDFILPVLTNKLFDDHDKNGTGLIDIMEGNINSNGYK